MKKKLRVVVIGTGNIAGIAVCVLQGREAVVVEHVNRMCEGIAPEWEKADTVGCMRIKIEGDPNVTMDCSVGDPNESEELAY